MEKMILALSRVGCGSVQITERCEEQASRLEFVAHFKIIEHQGVTINAAHSLALAARARRSNKINSLRKRDTARAARRERRKRNNLRRIKLLSHYITSVELIRWHVLLLNEMIHINLNQCDIAPADQTFYARRTHTTREIEPRREHSER